MKQQQQQQQLHLNDLPSSSSSSSSSSPSPNPNPITSFSQHHNSAALWRSASHLTRPELLKRRLENLSLLSKCYRELYWALMDHLKAHFRHYLWHYGLNPFRHSRSHSNSRSHAPFLEGSGENNNNNNNNNLNLNLRSTCNLPTTDSDVVNNQTCAFVGCKLKAMPLTTFCHLHILSDSRQKLYKPCSYVIKSAQAGPITCGKPILRSTVPSLCTVHFQKAQKHLTRTLKRTGLNVSSTNKTAPKFQVILTEYVHHIQVKRRTELRGNKSKIVVQKENDS